MINCGSIGDWLTRNNHNFCIEYNVTPCWYDMDDWKSWIFKIWYGIKNSDWMTGVPFYNTSICKKSHGKVFEGFVINTRNYRYNNMCSIDAY